MQNNQKINIWSQYAKVWDSDHVWMTWGEITWLEACVESKLILPLPLPFWLGATFMTCKIDIQLTHPPWSMMAVGLEIGNMLHDYIPLLSVMNVESPWTLKLLLDSILWVGFLFFRVKFPLDFCSDLRYPLLSGASLVGHLSILLWLTISEDVKNFASLMKTSIPSGDDWK